MNISFIIFFYNEEGNLKNVFDKVVRFIDDSPLVNSSEVILINDGSSDSSGRVAEKLSAEHPNDVHLMHHKQNLGIGESLRSGYRIASLDYICAVPGDDQFDVDQLNMLREFTHREFISYYRESNNVYSTYRNLLTKMNLLFNRWFLGLVMKDVNWIKVYRKSQLNAISVELTTSIIESEICAKLFKMGCRPIELPSTYEPRTSGQSKAGSLKNLWKVGKETYNLYRTVSKFNPKL